MAPLVLALALGCSTTGVDGRVVSGLDGSPLADVGVAVDGTQLTARTDATGRYRLVDVAPGREDIVLETDRYVASKPLSLTLEEGEVAAAADYVAFPRVVAGSAEASDSGSSTSLPSADLERWYDPQDPLMKGVTGYDADVQKAPAVSDGVRVLVGVDPVHQDDFEQGWVLDYLTCVPAGKVSVLSSRSLFGQARLSVPDRCVPFASDPVNATTLAPGLVELLAADPRTGPQVYRWTHQKSLLETTSMGFALNRASTPVVAAVVGGHQALHLGSRGTFRAGTPEWEAARGWLTTWCSSSEAVPECATGLPLLQAATSTGAEECLGELAVDKRQASFSTSKCPGALSVFLQRDDDGDAVPLHVLVPRHDVAVGIAHDEGVDPTATAEPPHWVRSGPLPGR